MRDIQGRRGITDFSVVADGTNNTGEVIDRNEFVADIFIKPARSINFIQLNFIAVRTGVAFSEIGVNKWQLLMNLKQTLLVVVQEQTNFV